MDMDIGHSHLVSLAAQRDLTPSLSVLILFISTLLKKHLYLSLYLIYTYALNSLVTYKPTAPNIAETMVAPTATPTPASIYDPKPRDC